MNRFTLLLLLFASVLFVSGCRKQDEIREYDVERIEINNKLPANHPPMNPPRRVSREISEGMLGLILHQGEKTWFFKMVGSPNGTLKQLKKIFDFADSMKMPDENSPPTWKLPKGWKQEKGSGMRFATIKFDDDKTLEMSVILLPRNGASKEDYLLLNINRWRKQLGLRNISLEKMRKKLKGEDATGEKPGDVILSIPPKDNGLKFTFVSFLGFKQSNGMSPPFANMRRGPFSSSQPKPSTSSSSLKQTVPENWKQGRLSSMRQAAFEVEEGNEKVEITVMTAGGGLLPNVNRWRGQVNLKPIGKDELKNTIQPIRIDGHDGMFFELIGTKGTKNISIFAIIVEVNNRQWFIKLTGDSWLAAKEKERFLAYAKSIKF